MAPLVSLSLAALVVVLVSLAYRRYLKREAEDRAMEAAARTAILSFSNLVEDFVTAHRDALTEDGPRVILRVMQQAASPNYVLTEGLRGEGITSLDDIGLHPADRAMLASTFRQMKKLSDPRGLRKLQRDAAVAAPMLAAAGVTGPDTKAALRKAIATPRDFMAAQARLMGLPEEPVSVTNPPPSRL